MNPERSEGRRTCTGFNEATLILISLTLCPVADILTEYGDIADVMEVFGVKRVGRYPFRCMLTKALTVERAAFVHRVPLDEFIATLNKAIEAQEVKAAAET